MIENVAFTKNVIVEKWVEFGTHVYESKECIFMSRKEILDELRNERNEKTVFFISLFNDYELDFEDVSYYLLRLRDLNVEYYYDSNHNLDIVRFR